MYPPRPESAPRPVSLRLEEWLRCHYLEVMLRRHVASRPPRDMPSTPAALDSPLAAAASSGFRSFRFYFAQHSSMTLTSVERTAEKAFLLSDRI